MRYALALIYGCRYEQVETAVLFGCFQGTLTVTSTEGIAHFFSVSVGSFEQDLPITAAASLYALANKEHKSLILS